MKTKLHLSLKEKWYRMIEKGEKKEEYREITQYWVRRLVQKESPLEIEPVLYRQYDEVEFTLGYPKKEDKSRRMTFEIKKIDIGLGSSEWGAPKNQRVFIITLGRKLS